MDQRGLLRNSLLRHEGVNLLHRAGKIVLLLALGGTLLQTATACQNLTVALVSNVLTATLLQSFFLGGIAT